MSLSRTLQYAFIAIVTISVGFSLYQWNASRASSTVKLNSSPTASLTSGLVGYWTFDGKDTPWSSSSAGTATDRSGNSNTGTLTNMSQSTSSVSGQIGQALNFDGSNDYIALSTLQIAGATTLSAWIYPNNVSGRKVIIGRLESGSSFPYNYGYGLLLNGSTLIGMSAYNDLSWANNLNATVQAGVWQHVVFTITGSSGTQTGSLYVNGALIDSYSGTANPTIAYPFGMGAGLGNFAGSFFNGKIDDVRSYNRALSATEVQSLYDLGASDKVNSSVSQNQGTGRLDSGLVGYWKLDDASGTTATDSSTNASTGTLTNGPTWTTGYIGSGVSFDGVDDVVNVGSNSVLNITSTSYTISAWIYPTGLIYGTGSPNKTYAIFDRWDHGCTGYGYGLFATNNVHFNSPMTLQLTANCAGQAWSVGVGNIIVNNLWQHVVAVDNAGTVTFYVNNVATPAANTLAATASYGGPALIGAGYGGGFGFPGSIDEVRVYNRALSADEVSQLYRLTAPTGVDTSLKGYWSFNGKDTNWTSSSAGTVSDLSGNGNTGTMTNMSRTTSPVEGKLGQALNFDGTDDFVQASNASSLQFANATPITLSAWVKPSQVAAYATFLIKGRDTNDSEGNYAFRQSSTGKLEFYYNESGNTNWHVWTTTSAVFSTANQWYHVAVTYTFGTGSSIRAYINGESVAGSWSSGTGNVAPDISTQKLMIGQITTGERFTGLIDEVRIYNRALIASEIASLYNNGKVVLNSTKKIYITTPGAGTFSAPADWPGTADKVEVIGGGAAGGYASNLSLAGAGGGGGAYARKSNVAISNGASLQVGSGGVSSGGAGGDTWVVSTGTIKAVGAPSHTYNVAGIGGAAGSSVGDTVYSGGNGGSILAQISIGGGGGGGAAGPRGAGKNGGNSGSGTCCEISGGGGGGGAGGGSSTAGSNSGTGDSAGAPGGTAQDGTAGGTANNNGSHGSGAGGGWNGTIGGIGGNGVEFDSTHGAGGGGGGGGAGGSSYNGGAGGAGGRYGGGGGGGNDAHDNWQPGGAGGQGIIVITYTPS